MPKYIAGELATAALRALPTDKLKSIWKTLEKRNRDIEAVPEPGDYDVMDDIRKILRDRDGPEQVSGRALVQEAMLELYRSGGGN